MDKLLLRPGEAAEVIGVSRSRVYELLQTGVLPRVVIGTSVRIPVVELNQWIKNRLTPSNDATTTQPEPAVSR